MIIEKVNIKLNRQIADNIWEMVFDAPNIASKYVGAGQFISILANDSWGHPLRRPMSIASVKDNDISIIYRYLVMLQIFYQRKIKVIALSCWGQLAILFQIGIQIHFLF